MRPDAGIRNAGREPEARQEWYRLDNAATLFSLVSSPTFTCMFRIEAALKKPVNARRLQHALDNVIERFPYYQVNLARGLFWHFWDTTPAKPLVIADSPFPCEQMPVTRRGIFPFRVRARGNRAAVEFHHSITDGAGGIAFFKALLAEYLRLSGKRFSDKGIFRPEETPALSEYEDAYKKYYRHGTPSPVRESSVCSLPLKKDPSRPYTRTTGLVPLADLLPAVKRAGVSLTEFLTAVLLESFQDALFALPERRRRRRLRPIRIMVPVNLRNIYPSATMRNFSLYVNPSIDPRLGRYEFTDILKEVYHYMKTAVDKRNINRQIRRNVRAELHPLLRATPLFLKKPLLKIANNVLFTSVNNAVLTNLGRLDVPAGMAAEMDDFRIFFPPSPGVKVCLALSTYKHDLCCSFGRLYREAVIERNFFRKLTGLGMKVKIC